MLPAQYEPGTLGGSAPGEIKEEKPGLLGKLLVAPSDKAATGNHVLPDPWSHTLLFGMELAGRLTRERKAIATKQWRGLIALFALREQRKLALIQRGVLLPKIAEGARAQRDSSQLLQSLAGLRPVGTLADRTAEWSVFDVIFLEGTAVGLVVPHTIVCPSRSNLRELPGCTWIEDGRFTDPLSGKHLSSDDITILDSFCESALRHLDVTGREPKRDQLLYDCLRREFKALRDEAAVRLRDSAPHRWMTVQETHNPSPSASQPTLLLDYRAVMEFRGTGAPNDCWSESILQLRDDLGPGRQRQIILLDPPDTAFDRPPQDVKVWRQFSLQDVRKPEILQKVRAEISIHGFLAVTTEDFFTPKLTKVVELVGQEKRNALSQRLPKQFHDGARQFLLPLSPLTLLIATPAQLLDGKTCQVDGAESDISCRLTLRLQDNPLPVTLSKRYERPIEVEAPAHLAIWPNFRAEDWHQYYVLDAVNVDQQRFMLGQPHTAATIAEVLALPENRNNAGIGNDLKQRKLCARADARKKEDYHPIFDCRYLPEAFPALYTAHAFDNTADESILGLLVVPPSLFPETQRSGETCKIGVDFGSTKSTVYWSYSAQEPTELDLESRVVRLLTDADNERPKEFLPTVKVKQPVLTAFRERDSRALVDLISPVVSGYIYFVDDLQRSLEALANELKGAVSGRNPTRFDLKWGKDGASLDEQEAQRTRTTLFIQQLVLLCAAEAVAKGIRLDDISWCFGFPEAFPPRMRAEFQYMVGQAVERADGPSEPKPSLLSESHAAGLCFLYPKPSDRIPPAQKNGHFITIDIGGSTSDICIWQDAEILWRNSVRLAGSEMLIQPMTEGPGRLKLLSGLAKSGQQLGGQAAALQGWLKTIEGVENARHLRSLVEMIIGSADFAAEFTKNINSVTVHQDAREQARLIEAFVGMVLCSLMYYIGAVIEVMKKEGRFIPRPREQLPIYIGGRGSLVCKRFVEGTNPALRNGILSLLLKTTPNSFIGGSMHYSARPKHEVAHGCVLWTPDRKGAIKGQSVSEAKEYHFLILGEQAHEKGATLAPDTRLSGQPDGKEWVLDTDLPSLKALLKHLRDHCDIAIEHDDFPNIARAVDEDTINALSSGSFEPPFILVVRRLLSDLASGYYGCRLLPA